MDIPDPPPEIPVKLDPSIAGSAPVKLEAASEPSKLVAVITPAFPNYILLPTFN